jgi:hypothetical protein
LAAGSKRLAIHGYHAMPFRAFAFSQIGATAIATGADDACRGRIKKKRDGPSFFVDAGVIPE